MVLYPKKDAPWRRVTQTVDRGGGMFYDALECGHRETFDVVSRKRRCRACADPTFPGIDTAPIASGPPVVRAEAAPTPAASSEPPGERPSPIPLVLTVEEVADLLRVNPKTVYQAATRGEIPGVRRIGRKLRFYGPTLAQWLETGTGSARGRRARR